MINDLKLPEFIFFDLDDTLIDDERSTEKGVDALFAHYLNDNVNDRHQRWDAALQIYYPNFLAGNLSVQQLQQARIRHVLSERTFSDEEALAAFEYFMAHYVEQSTLFSDVNAVFARLKAQNIGVGVISNGPNDMQMRKLKSVGLYDDLAVIVTAERAGIGKPNAAIFELALGEAGKPASACWCVGDNLNNDAIASSNAGLTGILLDRTGQHAAYTGLTIQSLDEIL